MAQDGTGDTVTRRKDCVCPASNSFMINGAAVRAPINLVIWSTIVHLHSGKVT